MTEIVIDIRRPSGSGEDVNVSGQIEWYPTRRHGDSYVVLPNGFVRQLSGEAITITVTPNDETYCWAVIERTLDAQGQHDLYRRFVDVPDSESPLQYVDLVDVDPNTFVPLPTPEYLLNEMIVSGSVVDGDLILEQNDGDTINAGNVIGPAGVGVPTGGTAGQILAKVDADDYDTLWIDNYASELRHLVKAGEVLTKGQAVYVSSADGTNMVVSKASNASEGSSSKTLGLIAQNLALNANGFVITEGLLSGLNTNSANVGDPVWLGVDGALLFGLANKPVAPAHLVYIGVVTRKNQNNGEIFVHIQNGFELQELHNVKITDPQPGDVLTYDSVLGLWVNSQP